MASSNTKGQLTKRDLASIQNYLVGIKHKWIDIGVQLELDPEYLEQLSTSSTSSDGDNMRRMILKWLTSSYSVPRWQVLCDALRTPAINEVDVADCIEKERMLMEKDIRKDDTYTTPIITGEESTKDFITTKLQVEADESVSPAPIENEELETDGSPAMESAKEPFPYLSTSGLSSKERDDLLGKLIQEAMEICFKFAGLVTRLEISLLDGNVDITRLKDEMKYFSSYIQDTISSTSNISGAVGVMNESWNFCNFSLLEHMLMKYGSSEDRVDLGVYKQSLAEFSQRRIHECPTSIFGGSPSENEVIFTVKRNDKNSFIHDVTLTDVQKLCHQLREEISVRDCTMRLLSAGKENESLVLTFGIVSPVLPTAMSLFEDHGEKLTSLGIWHASCGEQVFEQKNQYDEEDCGSLSDHQDETLSQQDRTLRSAEMKEQVRGPPVLVLRNRVDYRDEEIGTHVSIAINNQKIVVEVSNSSMSNYKSYKIGLYKKGQLEWFNGMMGNRYGTGKAPKIALNNKGYVVEVDEELNRNLSYRVGIVHSNAILWTEGCIFTTGTCPSVALYHKTVIATFKRCGDAFYQIGTLDTDSRLILWSTEEHKFISSVSDLAVAVNHNCIVVAVYTKSLVTSTLSPLYATVGALNRTEGKILFSSVRSLSLNFSIGNFPSVALNRNNDLIVLSTHQKSVIQKRVEYKLGLVKKEHKTNAYDIKWSSDKGTLDCGGERASVTTSDKGVVLISHVTKGKCSCHIGKLSGVD